MSKASTTKLGAGSEPEADEDLGPFKTGQMMAKALDAAARWDREREVKRLLVLCVDCRRPGASYEHKDAYFCDAVCASVHVRRTEGPASTWAEHVHIEEAPDSVSARLGQLEEMVANLVKALTPEGKD